MCKSLTLGFLLAAACFGQAIQVSQGVTGDDKWANLTLSSVTSYVKTTGGKFTPSLTVRCEAKGKPGKEDYNVNLLLDTGGVAPGTMSTRATGSALLSNPAENPEIFGRETLLLPMKLDGHQQNRTWELLPKNTSIYAYMGAGVTGIGSILSPTEMVEKVLGARVVALDFQPFGQSDVFESKFLPGNLKKEFQQHHECSLK